jgi:hypothetical protein
MKLSVIAGNIVEFTEYAGTKSSLQDYEFVSSHDYFIGRRNVKGIFIGTWYKRSDIFHVLMALIMCNAENNFRLPQAVLDKLVQEKPENQNLWPALWTKPKVIIPPNTGSTTTIQPDTINASMPIINGGTGQTAYNSVLDKVLAKLNALETTMNINEVLDYEKNPD